MKKIILTGGGTAGHVTPNIALIPRLRELDYDIHYIGSFDGIERKLIEDIGIPYYPIHTGKLRRYFDVKNFTDPFRVIKGGAEAKQLIKEIKPNIIFSKGGFVSVPVVKAAQSQRVPVIIHESDMTPGLANKLSFSSADKVCCNFPETLQYLPSDKAVVTGSPIREELLRGSSEAGYRFCGFDKSKPVLMVIGGSIGAGPINDVIHGILPELLKRYQVVHLCGKGKTNPKYANTPGYAQFEYLSEELPDIFAMADLIISRAGANSICEILALCKPNILIPLSAKASRGDQLLNAASFEAQGFSKVLQEEELSGQVLMDTIREVFQDSDKYYQRMSKSSQSDAVSMVISLIEELAL